VADARLLLGGQQAGGALHQYLPGLPLRVARINDRVTARPGAGETPARGPGYRGPPAVAASHPPPLGPPPQVLRDRPAHRGGAPPCCHCIARCAGAGPPPVTSPPAVSSSSPRSWTGRKPSRWYRALLVGFARSVYSTTVAAPAASAARLAAVVMAAP